MKGIAKRPYSLLLLLLTSCFLVHFAISDFGLFPNLIWLKSFSLDMASEIIGILLVVFSIDRVIALEQEKERQKLEQVAVIQLRRPLLSHFYLFFNMFKASVLTKPETNYENVSDLFDGVFFSQIAYLDFSSSAPVFATLEASWSDYLSRECMQFKDSLNRTMEKYALFLPPEVLDLMEEIINSPFMWLVLQAPIIRKMGRKKGKENSHYQLLARQEIRELLKDYTDLISQLFEYYNSHVPAEKKIGMTNELWADDLPPKMGTSRKKVVTE
ncbi:MAG: hypothetical protein ACOC0N_08900 [Chroococcales cyanobacterium]